jgi:hypothetical protein
MVQNLHCSLVVPTDGCHDAENDWRSLRGNEQEQRLTNGTCLYVSELGKVKMVKVTLVQALRLCTGRTAHRGSTGIALLFHDHGTRGG